MNHPLYSQDVIHNDLWQSIKLKNTQELQIYAYIHDIKQHNPALLKHLYFLRDTKW